MLSCKPIVGIEEDEFDVLVEHIVCHPTLGVLEGAVDVCNDQVNLGCLLPLLLPHSWILMPGLPPPATVYRAGCGRTYLAVRKPLQSWKIGAKMRKFQYSAAKGAVPPSFPRLFCESCAHLPAGPRPRHTGRTIARGTRRQSPSSPVAGTQPTHLTNTCTRK